MKNLCRFILVFIVVAIATAWCSSRLNAEERAKPRDRDGEYTKTERNRERTNTQAPANRDNARRRQPQSANDGRRDRDNNGNRDRNARTDAQRRHPRPDGRYDHGRYDNRRDNDRYRWRNHGQRQRWDRDRFPRYYGNRHLFDHRYYRGYMFGPDYRLWYYDRNVWRMCYWAYQYAPPYGCGWYRVPLDHQLVYDPYSGEEYWEYTDYQYIYLCFN